MTDPADKPKDPGALAPEDVVPAGFVAHRPKLRPGEFKDPKALETLKGKQVEVTANAVTYRGLLVGSDGEDLYLRTDLRHITIPMDRVARVVAVGAAKPPLQQGAVDPAFFDPMPGDEDA